MLIVRSNDLLNLIQENCALTKISVDPIDISRVVRSQRGVIAIKKDHLAYRLYQDELLRINSPQKRVRSSNNLNILEKWKFKTTRTMQKHSRQFTPQNGYYLMTDVSDLRGEMRWYLMQLSLIKLLNFPLRAFRNGMELLAQKLGRR